MDSTKKESMPLVYIPISFSITNINKEVFFYKMVLEILNLGPGAPNLACGSTAKKCIEPAAICEYDPENMLLRSILPLRASKF